MNIIFFICSELRILSIENCVFWTSFVFTVIWKKIIRQRLYKTRSFCLKILKLYKFWKFYKTMFSKCIFVYLLPEFHSTWICYFLRFSIFCPIIVIFLFSPNTESRLLYRTIVKHCVCIIFFIKIYCFITSVFVKDREFFWSVFY